MKKIYPVIAVALLVGLITYFPPYVTTQSPTDVAAGATPPLGVVRDGNTYKVWNVQHIGIILVFEGLAILAMVVHEQKKTTSQQ
ncbi:hypothetical protein G7061_02855 [Erysipelothrix sp. HDW6B]|uniref:hypothetical protein n=1 Tax=Erysipelothrix sp. HDW6B TaxID=2714929 RepID=UPI00140A40F6|nr:hypothetical protein [Erysipelothrix sp. HDW6B]QIK85615.1 hypothetical protein G7061_02855 [Erysipelothrix sp. HDW6B]